MKKEKEPKYCFFSCFIIWLLDKVFWFSLGIAILYALLSVFGIKENFGFYMQNCLLVCLSAVLIKWLLKRRKNVLLSLEAHQILKKEPLPEKGGMIEKKITVKNKEYVFNYYWGPNGIIYISIKNKIFFAAPL